MAAALQATAMRGRRNSAHKDTLGTNLKMSGSPVPCRLRNGRASSCLLSSEKKNAPRLCGRSARVRCYGRPVHCSFPMGKGVAVHVQSLGAIAKGVGELILAVLAQVADVEHQRTAARKAWVARSRPMPPRWLAGDVRVVQAWRRALGISLATIKRIRQAPDDAALFAKVLCDITRAARCSSPATRASPAQGSRKSWTSEETAACPRS